MPVIEILAYTTKDMDKFVPFVIDGKPDGMGGYETDEQGRLITGVLDWLRGRGVPEAHFFNSAKADDVQLFAATVQRVETYDVPWMRRIPGFEVMVSSEGLIGKTKHFAPLSDLLASVKSNPVLDEEFNKKRAKLEEVLKRMEDPAQTLSVGKRGLLAALRGDVGTDLPAVSDEVKAKFNISL